MATLRRWALNILRGDTSKLSLHLKRLRAGWDTDYLTSLFARLQFLGTIALKISCSCACAIRHMNSCASRGSEVNVDLARAGAGWPSHWLTS